MFERFTTDAKSTIVAARREASLLESREIRPEHILLALLNDKNITSQIMKGVPVNEIRDELPVALVTEKPSTTKELPLDDGVLRAFYSAANEADRMNEEGIGNEHLLLGLLDSDHSEVSELLRRKGIKPETVRSKIAVLRVRNPALQTKRRPSFSPSKSTLSVMDKEGALLRRIAQLVGSGKSRKALGLIDAFINESAEDNVDRSRRFAAQGGAIARAIGDIPLATKYYEMASKNVPDNLSSLYGMADVLELQGRNEEARKLAKRCYQLAIMGSDSRSAGFIELLEKRFPGLSAHHK